MPKIVSYPDCRRCNGKGGLIIRLGEPGQDHRDGLPIRWQEPWSVKCPVCKGAGIELKKPREPKVGKYKIVETAEDRRYFESETAYLINRWRLDIPLVDGGEKF